MTHSDVRNDLGVLRLLDSGAVAALPWEPLDDLPGVQHKVLWQTGAIAIGLIRLAPGASEPGPPHHAAHHHFFVLEGTCTVAGTPLDAGSYAYVPPGTPHPTVAGPSGATLFFSYRPLAPRQPPAAPLSPEDVSPA